MEKEIGSSFWSVSATVEKNHVFPAETQWFLSGRGALRAIAKELVGCKTIAMPSWCCESMIIPFVEEGFEVCFYSVYYDSNLIQVPRFDADVLFVMDYFGYNSNSLDLSSYQGIIIRDVTHSIFSSSYDDADYYCGSIRKWSGFWTGGYVWTKDGHRLNMEYEDDRGYVLLREKAMRLKTMYFADYNNDNIDAKTEFLRVFQEAEDCLDEIVISPASDRDVYLAEHFDVNGMKSQRQKNAKVLMNAFPDLLLFPKMDDSVCPLYVPILVPSGYRKFLQNALARNRIYCPVHWPLSSFLQLGEREAKIYSQELSLVCDQRYTEEDMNRIVNTIQSFWRSS